MRKLFLAACILAGMSGNAFAAKDESDCRALLETVRTNVESTLHDASIPFAQKKAIFSELFAKDVNIAWIGRSAAGTYWDSASEAERHDFTAAYAPYLVNHYIGGLNEEDIRDMQNFVVKDFAAKGAHGFEAHIDITQTDDEPVTIMLQLEEEPQGVCRIHDFTAEGVSLLQSQRDQIQMLAGQGGMDYVTKKIKLYAKSE